VKDDKIENMINAHGKRKNDNVFVDELFFDVLKELKSVLVICRQIEVKMYD